MSERRTESSLDRPEVRWGLGCLLGGVAMTGLLILVFLIAIALEPPAWVQVILALALVGAGGTLAVLVATALDSRNGAEPPGPRPVDDTEDE